MRAALALLLCASLYGSARGATIPGSASSGARGDLTFEIGGIFRVRRPVSDPVTLTGALDTETEVITYDAQQWTVPAGQRTRRVRFTRERIPAKCDINGCTPEIVIEKDFNATISFDPFSVSMKSFSVPITHYEARTATTAPPPSGLFSASEITGTWRIDGPTESQSGTFSIPGGASARGAFGLITLVRDPVGTGPVVGWAPLDLVIRGWVRRGSVASGIVVDGSEFSITTVPEPSSMAALALAAAALVAPARRTIAGIRQMERPTTA